MKEIVFKTLLLFSLICLFHIFVDSFTPFWYGNQKFGVKYKEFKNSNNYNTLFVGSSRTNRGLNSKIINKQIVGLNSFNIGIDGLFYPECLFLVKNIINESRSGLEYIFVEFQGIHTLSSINVHTPKEKYYLNFKTTRFVNEYYSSFCENSQEKPLNYQKAFLYNFLNIGLLRSKLKAIVMSKKLLIKRKAHDFVSLDIDALNGRIEQAQINANNIYQEMDSSEIFQNHIEKHKSIENYNCPILVKKLNEITEEAKHKGIRIIYFIPPRPSKNALNLVSYLKENSTALCIDFSSIDEYPELYLKENGFDFSHLNGRGASIFSNEFVKKLKELNF